MPRRYMALGSVIAAAFVACKDEPTAARGLPLCTAPVAVTVSAGLTPTLNWSPACRVSTLRVRHAADGSPVWSLFADPLDERAIAPGVRYGDVPPGVFGPLQPAPPLEAGTSYVLILTAIAIPIGELEVGREEFTP
jgi:hypothetical protein